MYRLNVLYYNCYIFEKWTQELFSLLIYIIFGSFISEERKKLMQNNYKLINSPLVGVCATFASVHYYSLFFFTIMGSVIFFVGLWGNGINLTPLHFFMVGIISYIPPYVISFKANRYIRYFKEYEKKSRVWKNITIMVSILVEITVWVVFIGSFIFTSNQKI